MKNKDAIDEYMENTRCPKCGADISTELAAFAHLIASLLLDMERKSKVR